MHNGHTAETDQTEPGQFLASHCPPIERQPAREPRGKAESEGLDFSASVAESLPQLSEAAALGAAKTGCDPTVPQQTDPASCDSRDLPAETCDLMQRLGAGGLLATVIERCVRLIARDKASRTRYIEDVHRHFRELCPPGVSSIEVEAAERVAIAKAKVLAYDLITLDPARWSAPDEVFFKMQTRASKELDRAMKLYLALRKAATAQPGFRVTLAETEQDGTRSQTRSVSYEQLPDTPIEAT